MLTAVNAEIKPAGIQKTSDFPCAFSSYTLEIENIKLKQVSRSLSPDLKLSN